MSENIATLESGIIKAATSLISASLSLRSCYYEQDSSYEVFIELRSRATNYAKVYEKKVLPIANIVVRRIEDFCDNFRVLSFEKFVEGLPKLTEDVNNYVSICKYMLELHKVIHANFKVAEDLATEIIDQMDSRAQMLECEKVMREEASSRNFRWGRFLFSIKKNVKKDELEVDKEQDCIYEVIGDLSSLVPTIDKFVSSLEEICGFFNDLTNKLTILVENLHKKIKSEADEIVKACRCYMSQIPACETNLRAIPDLYDENYVQEWLLRNQASTETNNEIPLAVLGRKLFASDKELINLINN